VKIARERKPFAKKSLGQNFLIDNNYVEKIVSALELSPTDTVVEIGPGRGALTEKLIEHAGYVIAIELDRNLVPELRTRFDETRKFTVIERDALDVNFAEPPFIDHLPLKLVANLPYYISTAILQRLIEQRSTLSEMVLMFQKEVVDRIAAKPGDSERGFLTVIVEAFLHAEKLFDVSPAAFRPVPKVTSAVVRMTPRQQTVKNEAAFRDLVSIAFAQKRKTILNNLKLSFTNANAALDAADIDSKRRAESLLLDEWLRLHEAIHGKN
jgi:16S rRNA (adenine1518-N6/adenine1519-N6)-dimethyltransferase